MPTKEQLDEDAKLTPEEREAKLAEAKEAYKAVDIDSVPKSEVHRYADGTEVVGVPPFPAKSPREQAEDKLERVGAPPAPPMVVPPGMPTSGEAAPSSVNGSTVEDLKARAQNQLESDVQSGKAANIPNPTTASDKPQLAGVGNLDAANAVDLTPEEIEALARQIQPSAEGASDAQAKDAATQVIRETGGPIVDDKADKSAKKK
jgi:hypothetical protein